MKIKCDYCGSMTDETKEKCEHCNAPNEKLKRVSNGVPKTIEELKQWYIDHNLPEKEVTRFFIGEDYQKPRAFGIYKNSDGNFIVYKNKDDGTRAIRYEGKDEVYAVNEIYMKLKEEIQNQKNSTNNIKNQYRPRTLKSLTLFVALLFVIMFVNMFYTMSYSNHNGYYNYNGTEYYKRNNNWYQYDYDDGWKRVSRDNLDTTFYNNYQDYYDGSTYSETTYGGQNIYDSEVSDSWSSNSSSSDWSSSSSWDSGSSWDSDSSWDSGSTDWSSDW